MAPIDTILQALRRLPAPAQPTGLAWLVKQSENRKNPDLGPRSNFSLGEIAKTAFSIR
jgi:hypothetical protein